MNLQVVIVIFVHVAFVTATTATGASKLTVVSAQSSKLVPVAVAGDPLSAIDSEIFDTTQSGEQKYKRAIAELDSLLGTINQEIETKTGSATTTAGGKRRPKREAYGGGWGHEEVSYGHGHGGHGGGWGGWAPSPPIHHHRVYHHNHRYHHGISPEFLLKTALVLKGILVLGHVAALG